jgi:hypothetical protein
MLTRTPLTPYRLQPTPPLSKPPKHLLIPPLHSDVTLHYLCLYVKLHYSVDTSPSTHLSPITSHPPIGCSLPSMLPPSTFWPSNSLHITSDMSFGQSRQSTITVSRPTHPPLHNRHLVQPFNPIFFPLCIVHRSRLNRCHHFPFFRQMFSSLQSTNCH